MSTGKEPSITDTSRVRSFGQNVTLCAEILNTTLEALATKSDIELAILSGFTEGNGAITHAHISALASELGLRGLDLLGTSGDKVRRTAVFKELLEQSDGLDGRESNGFDLSLGKTIFRKEVSPIEIPPLCIIAPAKTTASKAPKKALSVQKPQPTQTATTSVVEIEQVEEVFLKTVDPEEVTPSDFDISSPFVTKEPEVAPQETPEQVETSGTGIDWDKAGIVASLADGQIINLAEKPLRVLIAHRIRFLKGSLTFMELVHEAGLKKQPSWISSLEGGGSTICRSDVEKVATLCGVTVTTLLTGEGIVGLSPKETAKNWLVRYREALPDGQKLHDVASTLKAELEKWPKPVQNMLVNFLKEALD